MLDQAEAVAVELALSEPLPQGRLDATHYRSIHRHLFGDLYVWAGRTRRVRIHKGTSTFAYPEHIDRELDRAFAGLAERSFLRGLTVPAFAREAGAFMDWVNHIHPFREGNGRTLNTFIALLARQAGHHLDITRIDPAAYMAAMIAAYRGDEAPLAAQIEAWISP